MATDARLRGFSREEHAEAVERFRLLDRQQLDVAADRLGALLQKRRESLMNDPSPSLGTSLWVLRHEVNRKKGLRPLRELFTRAGDAILQLKPCLLMSPLSVSMHLDPSRIRFDLVIFDEASQIRPEDAIGSIMRGRQVIIVATPCSCHRPISSARSSMRRRTYRTWRASWTSARPACRNAC